jgi:hypothetical protein
MVVFWIGLPFSRIGSVDRLGGDVLPCHGLMFQPLNSRLNRQRYILVKVVSSYFSNSTSSRSYNGQIYFLL